VRARGGVSAVNLRRVDVLSRGELVSGHDLFLNAMPVRLDSVK